MAKSFIVLLKKVVVTLKEKLERLNAIHNNLFISENIPDNLSSYDFVFINSVSKGKLDTEDINKLCQNHPSNLPTNTKPPSTSRNTISNLNNAINIECIYLLPRKLPSLGE